MKRKFTIDFLIDGSPMLDPDAGVAIDFADFVSNGNMVDQGGYMHYCAIRSEIKTWHFSYAWLTAEEYAYMRILLRGKGAFSFTFKDENGKSQTVKAYCQKKSVSYWSARRGLYKDLQFDIIEC